jgi:cobalt/nickel transport system permease protein
MSRAGARRSQLTRSRRRLDLPRGADTLEVVSSGAVAATGVLPVHIPDGYLSPESCAVGYALTVPFWHVALKKTRRRLNTLLVPRIALFSAFCFVVMMFNLPVPGGTTAHAIGIAVATIVLGPWAAILAISIALLIQALFFGDGGITTFAFNSLNMGVIGAWVSYAVYRLIAGRAAVTSRRQIIAAGLAGYLAINVAALAAAIELGLQPTLFHAADGTPLYAPYPLAVAIPAMMIAHLTLAGVAEAVFSAGIVAWLQRSHPQWVGLAARRTRLPAAPAHGPAAGAWSAARRLWLGLGVLMLLTPLGLLASAQAWGEWGPTDFEHANAAISAQSMHHPAPTHAPQGMAHLASIWTAPVPDYAPAFMHSPAFGYILSALFGTGLIILVFAVTGWLGGRFGRGDRHRRAGG